MFPTYTVTIGFASFVFDQPEDREINHQHGWGCCAVGEYCREHLDLSIENFDEVKEKFPGAIKRHDYCESELICYYSLIPSIVGMKMQDFLRQGYRCINEWDLTTYGQLAAFIKQEFPDEAKQAEEVRTGWMQRTVNPTASTESRPVSETQ